MNTKNKQDFIGNKSAMKSARKYHLSALALAIVCSTSAMAQTVPADKMAFFNKAPASPSLLQDELNRISIHNFDVNQTEDGATEFKLGFNNFPVVPKAEKNDETNQLILNFGKLNIDVAQNLKHQPTKQVKSYTLNQNKDGDVVLTIGLGDHGRFTTRKADGDFYLKIYPSVTKNVIATTQQAAHGVESLSFNRTKGGEDQAIIGLASTTTPVTVKQVGSKLVVRFKGNKLPQKLLKTQHFNDVKAVVASAKAYNEGFDGVLELTPNGSYEFMAIQVEKKLTINMAKKKVVTAGASNPATGKFTGRKISMDFQNVEVRRVLQLLANYTGTNIVSSDTVNGNLSLRLQDVPWDQALDIILKSRGLSQRAQGNVIWVAPTEELTKHESNEAKAYAQSIQLAPLETTFIQLNYATAADVAALIRMEDASASGTDNKIENRQYMMGRMNMNGDDNTLLSPRGSVSYDARTNTLIINDTAKKIEDIRKVVGQIDIPVRQVMVEARIVRASTNFSKAMGVKWGVAKDGSQAISSSMDNLYNTSKYGKANEADTIDSNVNLDLGTSLGTSNIAFGLINTTDTLLGLELSALQSDGLGEVLSTPKVMTGDKQEATIRSGVKLPYKTTSEDSGTTTTFQDAVLELTVTPSITPDGTVQMKLSINKDTQGQLTDSGYAIDTNQLTTNVLVNNGETVVLGGLYEDTKTNSVEKVPVLGDIPGIGKLFRSKSKAESKQELLIFITPKIINDPVAKNATAEFAKGKLIK